MPFYDYESLSNKGSRFELHQSIHDDPLTRHPESGEPIKKIIAAGSAIRIPGLKRSTVVNKLSPAATACGCASNAALAASVLSGNSPTPRYSEPGNTRQLGGRSYKHHSHGPGKHC
ncbi:MAG: hypothetical protein HQM13_17820 [SAR324 cluster bacterium]|nr:hypothetical protein [SAR324 cluster bacterium]